MEHQTLERLIDLVPDSEIEHNGRRYTARKLDVVREPLATALVFHTLQALADFVDSKFDAKDPSVSLALHVEQPDAVRLFLALNEDRARECLAEAVIQQDGYPFGQFIGHEAAMIGLQSTFKATPERAALLKVLGTVTAEEVRISADDGVTQSATASAGVTLKERVDLPSPVVLMPFRTFREVSQPASPFILRVRRDRDQALRVGLFEADGGTWKLDAVRNVAEWLRDHIDSPVHVFA